MPYTVQLFIPERQMPVTRQSYKVWHQGGGGEEERRGGCHASITREKRIVNSFPRGKLDHETTITIIIFALQENDSGTDRQTEREEEKQNDRVYTQ